MGVSKRHSDFSEVAIWRYLADDGIRDSENRLEDPRVYKPLTSHLIPNHIKRIFRLSDGETCDGENRIKIVIVYPVSGE
jgi:hypothetical protein